MTDLEALQRMLHGETPEHIIDGWGPFENVFDCFAGQIMQDVGPTPKGGVFKKDVWGVTLRVEPDQPGIMPCEGDLIACPDVTEWRSYITPPDPYTWKEDWSGAIGWKEAVHAKGKLALAMMPLGVFETLHNILGFEDCLMDLLAEPDDTHELVDAIFAYKTAYIDKITQGWHPDGIHFHDDWGSKDSLLMSPEVWREYFKPGYQKLYAFCHERGLLVLHHSDSNNDLIVQDMEECGIDIWQGCLPQCDITADKAKTSRMLFMGGIDAHVVDKKDVDPAVIRDEVRRCCEAWLPGGRFIPCLTYGSPDAIFPGVVDAISAAIAGLNAER